eukprot:TRINITY_DN3394_c1_g1_i2.p1 TRINITY_DN3394_c1_g1~~TRINITY_DN3394_c1_g1_i2.p1  ORF type:complete len:167 (-),score=49.79 TRINITY_DN3394_c1_g1_i2:176-676(-)
MSLTDLLNQFQRGRSHLAIVSEQFETLQKFFDAGENVPEDVEVEGIITIEDVIEEIIQEEIEDEIDAIREDVPNSSQRVVPLVSTDVTVMMAVQKFKKGLEKRRKRKISMARREAKGIEMEQQHQDKVAMVAAMRSDMMVIREDTGDSILPPSLSDSPIIRLHSEL